MDDRGSEGKEEGILSISLKKCIRKKLIFMRGMVGIVLIIFVVILLLMFIVGISGHWNPVAGDITGILTLGNAVKDTYSNFISMASIIMWTMIFFTAQGVFIFAYYKIARFIWVRIPEFRQWFEESKSWFER